MTFNRLLRLFYRIVRKLLKVLTGHASAEGSVHVRILGAQTEQQLMTLFKKIEWYAPDTLIFYIKTSCTPARLPHNIVLNSRHEADLILLTRRYQIFTNVCRLHRCLIIDPGFYDTEECVAWSYLYGMAKGVSEVLKKQSADNLRALTAKHSTDKKACCFLTGQSFSDYLNHPETRGMFKVICNSVVKNNDFMAFNRPDLLCFADPVYHFSYNEYSVNFRNDMLNAAAEYDFYIAVPENMMPLMLAHYPSLKDRLIGIGRAAGFNFPTPENMSVKVTDNILTYLMLPLASSVCREIYLLGADGRAGGDKGFWKHNSAVQYDSLMQSVVNAHPSFFRDRNYVQYQKDHDSLMEDFFRYGEDSGKTYVSLNKSNLDSINSRFKGE